ncbi:MAG TPA: hypothetical protein VJ650_12650 [Gemmatimonadaceae bacterium]|nr:hypothetical protein [Gemmatimonadaceae bacterium]
MRRFLQDLSVLAAVTAAGGFALTRAITPAPAESPLVLEPIFVGAAHTPVTEAMHVLRNAPEFASAPVGYSGDVPTVVVAWLTVLYDREAESNFLELVWNATPAGRAYALTGLRARSLPLFHEAARPLRQSQTPVNTRSGGVRGTTTTAQIVAALEHGAWIGELVSAPRSRYFGDLPWPE